MFKLPGFTEQLTNSPTNVENNGFAGWSKWPPSLDWSFWRLLPYSLLFFHIDLQSKYSGSGSNLYDASKLNIYIYGPAGIHVYVTDEVLGNIKDESLFALEIVNNKIVMKIVYKNEINWEFSSLF